MDDRTSFQEAMLAPWLDGAESNPLTRGNALLGDIRRDLGSLDANRATRQKSGLWRDEDETTYTQQRNADRLQIADLEHSRYSEMFSACLSPSQAHRAAASWRASCRRQP